MGEQFVGAGWAFPMRVGPSGGFELVSGQQEIEEASGAHARTIPKIHDMRWHVWVRIMAPSPHKEAAMDQAVVATPAAASAATRAPHLSWVKCTKQCGLSKTQVQKGGEVKLAGARFTAGTRVVFSVKAGGKRTTHTVKATLSVYCVRMDVKAYLDRIGYSGDTAPTLGSADGTGSRCTQHGGRLGAGMCAPLVGDLLVS